MFIEVKRSGYNRYGEQFSFGRFLVFVTPEDWGRRNEPIRAMVRSVLLRQCGHYMVGSCRAYNQTVPLSGAYGGDGLAVRVSDIIYNKAVLVPSELIKLWNEGGGWNGAGSEAKTIREWALKTFK